jgi:hypothetical protein
MRNASFNVSVTLFSLPVVRQGVLKQRFLMDPLYTIRVTDKYTTSIRQLTRKHQELAKENVLVLLCVLISHGPF